MNVALAAPQPRSRPLHRRLAFWEALDGWTMAMPAILGLLIFTIGPIFASFYFSLTNYNAVKPPEWVGLKNYIDLFTDDPLFYHSLRQTARASSRPTEYSSLSQPARK